MSAESENKEKPEETNENKSEKQPRMPFFGMPGWFHIIAQLQLQDQRYLPSDFPARKSTDIKPELRLPEKPAVRQEHPMGCAVACVAYESGKSYREAIELFDNGRKHAKSRGFYCEDIERALQRSNILGDHYKHMYIGHLEIDEKLYLSDTIVFVRRSKMYPKGHYLVKTADDRWMDPWINFPDKKIEAGFRDKLPDVPIYVIHSERAARLPWYVMAIEKAPLRTSE